MQSLITYMLLLMSLILIGSVCHAHEGEDHDAWAEPLPVEKCKTSLFTKVSDCNLPVGQSYDCEGRGHLPEGTELEWKHEPPHSGVHYPQWETQSGEHEAPIARGNWIHNLEHGHIVLLHNCPQGCEAELEVMREAMLERLESSILMTPDPLLTVQRFAAVAWTWVYRTDEPELDQLLCFIDQHQGNAPEDIPLH